MKSSRRFVAVAAAALAVGVMPTVDAVAMTAAARGDAVAPAAAGPVRVVTLITGDRVTVAGQQVGVEPGPGRRHITFGTTTIRGHLSVVPSDALPLVHAGRVDARLFDVTTLIANGYDDRRADLPLMVTAPLSGAARAAAPVRPALPKGMRVVRELRGLKGVATRIDRADRGAAWNAIKAAGAVFWLDGLLKPTLDVSVPQIGAPTAWAAGYTGTGVNVAVVDSGIDATHPDLAAQVIAERNFVESEDGRDIVGHGTHVASTIAGTGAASAGRFTGVAPGARLIDAKVCMFFGCEESAIIAGMQWAVAEQHAKVVNVSLGGGDAPGLDPLEQAVQDLSDQYGALFVIASGNAGDDRTVGSPGSAPAALTVGAVDSHDALAPFSSRGPAVDDSALKPDITAPGVGITAARSADSSLSAVDGQYTVLSGTSMATPHVAGSAAILAQRHPDWTGQQLKAALMASAKPDPATGIYGQGAGRVDVAHAITQTTTTSPASVSFGRPEWPHTDDEAVTRTVTYHNHGSTPVTLDLTVEAAGPAIAGMFTVGATSVTVPAGGQSDVTITADTRVAGPDGFFGGYLVARVGGAVTRTPFAVEKEVESYDLDLTVTNRAGQPASDYNIRIFSFDAAAFYSPFDPDGTTSIRLPKGRYLVQASVFDNEPLSVTELMQPVLDLRGPQRIALDARRAGPVTVPAPRTTAKQFFAVVVFAVNTPFGRIGFGDFSETFGDFFLGAVGRDDRLADLSTALKGQWARPQADGTMDDSPYTYNLAWEVRGRMPTGFHRVIRDRDLARVDSRYLSRIPGAVGTRYAFSDFEDNPYGGAFGTSFHTPFARTEFYSAGPDIRWDNEFDEDLFDDEGNRSAGTVAISFGVRYRAGHSYRDTWNRAIFGPTFPKGYDPASTGFAVRFGDQIFVSLSLFGDGDGRAGISTLVRPSRVTLTRDGVAIPNEDGLFNVPAEPGDYTLTALATRANPPFNLSTVVSAEWTFRSGHVDDTSLVPLPLSAVRFTPDLDDAGTAPANRAVRVPVSVESQLGSLATATASLSVEVSYDDGATWTTVGVRKDGKGSFVTLHHPRQPAFVSLRATATDTSGNSVKQTIIRAYQTR